MGFNPLKEQGIPAEKQAQTWSTLNVTPYDKMSVDPYTRCRIILMNGIEVEAAMFLHQMARHTIDPELKRILGLARRAEQQQQKLVNWMVPGNESTLEVTIGYEQVAVDLTAGLAQMEPDPYVKAALDFALLEDFDHLYRYADVAEMLEGVDPARIVGELTEIMPGRPTIVEHRHPFDEVRRFAKKEVASPLTKTHIQIITAGEQQTMNFYMNSGNRHTDPIVRGLYLEIGQIEEQHVSHYESLADPTMTWFERMVMHDYTEAYLYWSCMQSEPDARVKEMWERHLMMEIEHLRIDRELMQKHEGRDPADMLPPEFPAPMIFKSNKDYVRQVLAEQFHLTARDMDFVPIEKLPADHRYYAYQQMVNDGGWAPANEAIKQYIGKNGQDWRLETEGPHPIEMLRDQRLVEQEKAYFANERVYSR